MLEKLEIYPYQRINTSHSRRFGRRRLMNLRPKLNWKLPALNIPDFTGMLRLVLTVEVLLYAVTGFIMARAFVLGELLPFIYAYIAALGRKEKKYGIAIFLFACGGLATVISGIDLWLNIITLAIVLGVVNYIKTPQDKQWWGIPLLCAAVLLVVKGIIMVFTGISFYKGMIITFEAMMAGILTFVFMVAAESIRQRKKLASFAFEDIAAFVIVGIGIVMGLYDIHLGGVNIAAVLCRLGILMAAYLWGSGAGTMVGVMAGILPSISSSIFTQYLGLYAVSGLMAGVFRNFGRLGVIIGFMLGNLAISMFIPETQVNILGIWETGLACLLFVLMPAVLKEKVPIHSLGPLSPVQSNCVMTSEENLNMNARQQVENLAGLFDNLSRAFNPPPESLGDDKQNAYLNYLYDEISQGFCESCSRYDCCWGRDCYNTSQEILEIFALAESHGAVSYEECPVEFRRRCIYGKEMVKTVNYLFDNLRINEYWAGKLKESRNLLSRQFSGMGKVIKDLASHLDLKATVDMDIRQSLIKEGKKEGLNFIDLIPVKNGKELYVDIKMPSCADGKACEEKVVPIISAVLGENLEVCQKNCPHFMGRGACSFTVFRSFTYKVNSGIAQLGKEAVCGDSFTIATLKEGKELLALSDGMGVGEQAESESRAAVQLLENLLSTGFEQELALKTVNSVLLLRSRSESFTTLDMTIVDLYTAEVNFIKTGGVPSFIKRNKQVELIAASSLPMGILEEVEVFCDSKALYPGDIIVMVSDGVMEASRDGKGQYWIKDFLQYIDETDPQVIAEMIINKALSMCGGSPLDDMTVICLSIGLYFKH